DPPGHDAAFWYRKARDHNAGLEMSEISRNIAESQLGIARAALWPVLSANGSYTRTWSSTDYTRTSAGLSASWPLFSGFSRITDIQNARLDVENAELSLRDKERELEAHVYQQWETLTNAWQQVGFERDAVARAQQSLALSEEQYRLGAITDIQYRDAQLALLNACVRLESAIFQSKVASAQLEQLAGMLSIE
ncbi:MAG: hypothetical protein GF410_06500, partial [Chitinivibrionales bacterium]|nr:hypothetical protein [Chitinivibrionales bacterium]